MKYNIRSRVNNINLEKKQRVNEVRVQIHKIKQSAIIKKTSGKILKKKKLIYPI